jgi:hypothetical protein
VPPRTNPPAQRRTHPVPPASAEDHALAVKLIADVLDAAAVDPLAGALQTVTPDWQRDRLTWLHQVAGHVGRKREGFKPWSAEASCSADDCDCAAPRRGAE